MTQQELNDEVARVTGESAATIRDMGFVPLTEIPFEREPLAFDWDSREPESLSALDGDFASV